MKTRLSAVALAFTLVLCNASLIGLAAPGGKVFVTNSNDSGSGSFRDAIVQANGDATIATVQYKGGVSVIALTSTVVFSGVQDLEILGNAGHGVHVDDQELDGSGSAASVDVRVTKSLFSGNGFSVAAAKVTEVLLWVASALFARAPWLLCGVWATMT